MKLIRDIIRSREEKDPYQDIWQDGEKPIITTVQEDDQQELSPMEQLINRLNELEERVAYLESEATLDDD